MFFSFEKQKADEIDYWYALVPGFNTSGQEFYDAVEKELKSREVPGLEIFHVDFAEGSLLSDKREYLRLTRERLVFDVCAARFGTAYFFSCRFALIPAVVRLWQVAVVLVANLMVIALAFRYLGLILGGMVLVFGLALLIYVLRNAVAMGLRDLDAYLIKDPVFGAIYERYFRKETYYRYDTRVMYRDTVNAVVKALVEDVTGAKGIRLVQFNERVPAMEDLYRQTAVELPRPSQ